MCTAGVTAFVAGVGGEDIAAGTEVENWFEWDATEMAVEMIVGEGLGASGTGFG